MTMTTTTQSKDKNISDILQDIAMIQQAAKVRKIKLNADLHILHNRKFSKFQRTYRHDLAAFVHDIIDWHDDKPRRYQEHIWEMLPSAKRLAVSASRGSGKTTTIALVIPWALLTVDDVKVPITAGDWGQLSKYLWPEIYKWWSRLRWDRIGREPPQWRKELRQTDIELSKTSLTRTASPLDPARFEGAHASERLFVVFDEAKSIRAEMFDAAEGSFVGASEKLAIAASTPGLPMGRFYDICQRKAGYEDWTHYHITIDDLIEAGVYDHEWVDQRRRQWGENSALFVNQVLGEFAQDADDTVIPWHWVEQAISRWNDMQASDNMPYEATSIGIDVAAGGKDVTVLAFANEGTVIRLEELEYADTMNTTGYIANQLRDNPNAVAVIDVIGIGAGIYDRLTEQGFNVVPFRASAKAQGADTSNQLEFQNLRAQAWWALRERLDPSYNGAQQIALPDHDILKGELTAPRWFSQSSGRIQIESKDDIRKKLGRSTDYADAVIMALLHSELVANDSVEVSYVDIYR